MTFTAAESYQWDLHSFGCPGLVSCREPVKGLRKQQWFRGHVCIFMAEGNTEHSKGKVMCVFKTKYSDMLLNL